MSALIDSTTGISRSSAPARAVSSATVEFEVSDLQVDSGFPLPRPGSRLVTQEDFPTIIERTRAENAKTFGPGADAP